VAPRAGIRKYASTAVRITLERLETGKSLSLHLDADGHSAGQECEICHYVPHVPAGWNECRSIHAPAEAVVDSVLDQIDLPAPRAVLGISRECADPRHRIAAQSAVEMTTGAPQGIPDVTR
jgi:hypothetical protein